MDNACWILGKTCAISITGRSNNSNVLMAASLFNYSSAARNGRDGALNSYIRHSNVWNIVGPSQCQIPNYWL